MMNFLISLLSVEFVYEFIHLFQLEASYMTKIKRVDSFFHLNFIVVEYSLLWKEIHS